MIISLNKRENKVYVKTDNLDELLSFDTLIKLSKVVLKKHDDDNNEKFEVSDNENPSLQLYKKTIEEIINGIIEDDEFLELFHSTNILELDGEDMEDILE